MTSRREELRDRLAEWKGPCRSLYEYKADGRTHFETYCPACMDQEIESFRTHETLEETYLAAFANDKSRVMLRIVADLADPEGSFYYHIYAGQCEACGTLLWTHSEDREAAIRHYQARAALLPPQIGPRVRVVHVPPDDVQ